MSAGKKSAKFVAIDEDTAEELQAMAQSANVPVVQMMKYMSQLFKYALGRQVKIESKSENKIAVFDYSDYKKFSSIDD